MQITHQSITDLDKFYDKFLKDGNFSTAIVNTSWFDSADAVNRNNDIVLTDLSDSIYTEAVRRALELPYFSNDHAYCQQFTDGFTIDLHKSKDNNSYQAILDSINTVRKREYGLNSSTNFRNIWYLTQNLDEQNGIVQVNVYQLNNDVYDLDDVLQIFSKNREKELKLQKSRERQKQADQQFKKIKNTICRMSKTRKQEILKMLIK